MGKSVLIGMSGGVDSTMAAVLLKEKGYKVTGINLWFHGSTPVEVKQCLEKIGDQLGIEILFRDYREIFRKEVIGYFTRFHLQGLTPSPCAQCNPKVKWKLLLENSKEKGIDDIATGHYIQLRKESGINRIFKATDRMKDQSYYLWDLREEVLSRTVTPLGGMLKEEVIKKAGEMGFDYFRNKKESSGLCFSEGRSCSQMLDDYIPDIRNRIGPGKVIDRSGNVIGRHKGYIYYTIGQKKDMELNVDDKLCVVDINPEHNVLTVDTWQSLYVKEFFATDAHFFNIMEVTKNSEVQVRIRGFGLNPGGNCKVFREGNNLKVVLEQPAWAITPGQPVVFYSGDKLLGGALVTRK